MTIGQRIKIRREELNMSQDELAKRIGYKSRSSINKIELDLYNLKQSKIQIIADALDTTPSYIMGWEDDKSSILENFRNAIKGTISSYDTSDIVDSGANIQRINRILEDNAQISLDSAYDIAKELGESLNYLLGESPTETIQAALKYEDSLTAEIIQLILDLPESKQREALNYIRFLSQNEDK